MFSGAEHTVGDAQVERDALPRQPGDVKPRAQVHKLNLQEYKDGDETVVYIFLTRRFSGIFPHSFLSRIQQSISFPFLFFFNLGFICIPMPFLGRHLISKGPCALLQSTENWL